MLTKNFYIALTLSLFSFSLSHATAVEAAIRLQIEDRIAEMVTTINSEAYTHLSMENERLGFAVELANDEEGNEIFWIAPTKDKKFMAIFCWRDFSKNEKRVHFETGEYLGETILDKDLIIDFLAVKQLP